MDLQYFSQEPLNKAILKLFVEDLNIPLRKGYDTLSLPKDILKNLYNPDNKVQGLIDMVYFAGVVDEQILNSTESEAILDNIANSKKDYDGLLIFGVTLKQLKDDLLPTRTQLAEITRLFNRKYCYTPVVIVFKYDNYISITNCERLPYKIQKEGEKAGKVSLLKDVNIEKVHAGHERILLELTNIKSIKDVKSFADLYKYWQSVFDTSILNNRFYKDIANWFFWAVENVKFPTDAYKDKENPQDVANQIAVIRLLTRFIFVWFIKEKSLVKDELFDYNYLKNNVLNFKDKNDTNYYKAILQNLFFATLNTEMKSENRSFSFQNNESYLVAKYRYKNYFKNAEDNVKELFTDVPFLNGGLFDFLDKENPEDKTNPIRIDWFSDPDPSKPKYYRENALKVPDFLFFGKETNESELLNKVYDTKNQTYTVKGLINILKSYKFTVEENTPIDIEVALDPELLGKVFENLLAYYNPETGKTARKNLGAFYTPREIVNYMVDESLKAYLKQKLPMFEEPDNISIDEKLNQLFEYNELANPFDNETTIYLISALNQIKVLDPACGSGAFPMGVLQKIVYILSKLDPDNILWKHEQKEKVIGLKIEELKKDKELVKNISDKQFREHAIKEADTRIKEIETEFDNQFRNPDYLRKLYIIQDAIYGVDIQPIAVQISKLRFFLSLIIEQLGNPKEYNRGYVPLPNLETKFVSANTLIGLDKPAQQTLKSMEIAKLETEIKEIRKKHFFAKDRKEKRTIQKQDQQKRKEIAAQLKNEGWQNKMAEQLAGWNPYDQNQTADFFDTEWMFGLNKNGNSESNEIKILNLQIEATNKQIDVLNLSLQNVKLEHIIKLQFKIVDNQILLIKKEIENVRKSIENTFGKIDTKIESIVSETMNYDYLISSINARIKELNKKIDVISLKLKPASENPTGYFDIVIGNPPYISGLEASKIIDENIRSHYKLQFESAKGTYDIYILFFEKGLKLLNTNAILTYITPSKFLSANYAIDFRKFVIKKYSLDKIIDFSVHRVFESAAVSTIVSMFSNKKQIAQIETIFAKNKDLTEKIQYLNNNKVLTYYPENLWGMLLSENINIVNKIIDKSSFLENFAEINACTTANEAEKFEKLLQDDFDKHCIKFVNNGSIDRYVSMWGVKPIKKTMLKPYLDLKKIKNNRREKMFLKPKLIFVKLSKKPEILIDYKGEYASANTNMVYDVKNYNLKFLGGYFNSKLFDFIYGTLFGGLSMFGTYQFQAPQIRICPIPKIYEKAQEPFVKLVDRILTKKEKTCQSSVIDTDTSAIEREMDELFFKFYNLTYEDVKVIEPNFWLTKEEYNNLPEIKAIDVKETETLNADVENNETVEPKVPKKRGGRSISVDGLEF